MCRSKPLPYTLEPRTGHVKQFLCVWEFWETSKCISPEVLLFWIWPQSCVLHVLGCLDNGYNNQNLWLFFYLLRFCSKYLAFTLFALLREDRPPDGFFFFFPFYPVVSVSCYLSLVSIEPAWNDQCPYSIASSAVTLSVYRHWSLDNNYPTSFICNDRITLARFCRFSADVLALVRLYD